tara:strand:+ start:22243 stop:22488 length:246 start_codon:yes stop_codon:yes gene_type:complete
MSALKTFLAALGNIIPSTTWLNYSAHRLGTFIYALICINALIVLTLALLGITLGLGLICIIPISWYLAIRISEKISQKHKD